MIFRYRLFLRWWMVGGSLKSCLTQFVPEGTLPRHFVTWVNIQGPVDPCQNMPSCDIWILVSSQTQEILEGIIYIFTFGGFVCWKKIPEVHRSNRKLQDSATKLHITSIIHKERRFFKKDVESRNSVPRVLSSLQASYHNFSHVSRPEKSGPPNPQVPGQEHRTWQTPALSPVNEDEELGQVYCAWLTKWVVKRKKIQLAQLCVVRWWII